jgi:predicted HTH transcriptional regulator
MQLTITGPEDRLAALLESISDAAFYFRRVGDQVHIVAQLGTVTAVNDDEFEQTHAEPEPAPEVDTPDDKTPEVEAPTGTLSNNIVRHLKAHGPATTTDIANALGAPNSTTLAMLRRLREVGKVESAGRSGWKVAARRSFDHDAARRRAGQAI